MGNKRELRTIRIEDWAGNVYVPEGVDIISKSKTNKDSSRLKIFFPEDVKILKPAILSLVQDISSSKGNVLNADIGSMPEVVQGQNDTYGLPLIDYSKINESMSLGYLNIKNLIPTRYKFIIRARCTGTNVKRKHSIILYLYIKKKNEQEFTKLYPLLFTLGSEVENHNYYISQCIQKIDEDMYFDNEYRLYIMRPFSRDGESYGNMVIDYIGYVEHLDSVY